MNLERQLSPQEMVKQNFNRAAGQYLHRVREVMDESRAAAMDAAVAILQQSLYRRDPAEFEQAFAEFKRLNTEAIAAGDMFLNEQSNTLLALGTQWSEMRNR